MPPRRGYQPLISPFKRGSSCFSLPQARRREIIPGGGGGAGGGGGTALATVVSGMTAVFSGASGVAAPGADCAETAAAVAASHRVRRTRQDFTSITNPLPAHPEYRPHH